MKTAERSASSAALRTLGWALSLFVLWTFVTWVLEGRIQTLLRPEAAGARLLYAVAANLGIGTVAASLVLRWFIKGPGLSAAELGFRSPQRTTVTVLCALGLGAVLLVLQRPASSDPVVLVNAYAQTFVVSMAEVLVCWSVVGGATLATFGRDRRLVSVPSSLLISAVLFGLYHIAHSPPFNTVRMVTLLSVVGLVTGAFYIVAHDVYGTIIFHNFLALTGVTEALAQSGRLGELEMLQWPLIATAAVGLAVLISSDRTLIRSAQQVRADSS